MSITGAPEQRERAATRADELREMAAHHDGDEASALELLARIRERNGVALTRHTYNAGQFVDDAIDDFIDGRIA